MKTAETTRATKNLLKINPHALQFLHHAAGFDFEKPHTIQEKKGNFTEKTILKETQGENLIISLIIKKKSVADWDRVRLYYVTLENDHFNPGRHQTVKYWNFGGFDWYFSKGDFERARKDKDAVYYIISQEKQLAKEQEPARPVDLSRRFDFVTAKKCGDGRGNTYISEIELKERDKSGGKVTLKTTGGSKATVSDIIDKSGYIIEITRGRLKAAANKRRAEKAKAEYLSEDRADTVEALAAKIDAIKAKAGDALKEAFFSSDFRRFEKVCDILAYARRDVDNFREKNSAQNFDSVEQFNRTAEGIREDLQNAEKLLAPIQPGDIHAEAVKELPPEDIDHHESDLYLRFSKRSEILVKRLSTKALVSTFRDQIGGGLWYDLPLCYIPGVEESARK